MVIALAGNPNSGKTTLFNALTGSNQFVGNWPGVTVEKKEGRLKTDKNVAVMDLPGIYSLSPYTPEEIVTRNFLLENAPDVILNIIDGTNLERNLYLTTQLAELGIPMVIAINMLDLSEVNGEKLDPVQLSKNLGCPVAQISALKNIGLEEIIQLAKSAVKTPPASSAKFSETTEDALKNISDVLPDNVNPDKKRFYSIKLFEKDADAAARITLLDDVAEKIKSVVEAAETAADDDGECIIASERYNLISAIIGQCYIKRSRAAKTAVLSDKIDRVVTSRVFALPIFAAVMFLVYFISVTSVGTIATDWANDGVFGDGWHLFGIGSKEYAAATEQYEEQTASQSENQSETQSESEQTDQTAPQSENPPEIAEPDPADYGIWIPGIPALLEKGLTALNCAEWLKSLVLDGIVAGVGAVLGFVPQMLVLFLMLSFLESCGYMARIAFILDRIFRRFGLSGKSFIPILIGTGCGVPGIMASRTIENVRDRRITIMTTTFIPCSAKLPVIALISGAIFHGAWWVAPSAYFAGILAILISGVCLKKMKVFAGDPAPFVMELPPYRMPAPRNLLYSAWERGWSFIKKAGTIILISCVAVWFLSRFGFTENGFTMLDSEDIGDSVLAVIGKALSPIFIPLGWGAQVADNAWKATVASITGLIAKENLVGTLGVLYNFGENDVHSQVVLSQFFTPLAAYSFLLFNLLCSPCFAAIGAIKREMNSSKWTAFALCFQTGFAYLVAFGAYHIGNLFINGIFDIWTALALALAAYLVFLLVRNPQNSVTVRQVRSQS